MEILSEARKRLEYLIPRAHGHPRAPQPLVAQHQLSDEPFDRSIVCLITMASYMATNLTKRRFGSLMELFNRSFAPAPAPSPAPPSALQSHLTWSQHQCRVSCHCSRFLHLFPPDPNPPSPCVEAIQEMEYEQISL